MQSRVQWFGLMLFCLFTLGGCGSGRPTPVPVSGKVMLDDKPLTSGGSIVFIPDGGRQSTGIINKDGSFTLTCFKLNDGALIGKHRISVSSNQPMNGDTALKWFTPPKYSDVSTSGLTEEIKGSTDSIVIKVTWKGNNPSEPFIEKSGGESSDAEPGMAARMKGRKTGSNDKKN